MRTRDDQNFTWRKSSYSTQGSASNCVEVGWRKSSYSTEGGGNCVEVGPAAAVVGVRDTKNRAQGHFTVSRTAWAAFVRGITR